MLRLKSVERGAALLDERVPGWVDLIDPAELDLGLGCDCVLGQVFGEYERGKTALVIPGDSAARWFGFYRWPRQRNSRLTDAWRELIESRRASS